MYIVMLSNVCIHVNIILYIHIFTLFANTVVEHNNSIIIVEYSGYVHPVVHSNLAPSDVTPEALCSQRP